MPEKPPQHSPAVPRGPDPSEEAFAASPWRSTLPGALLSAAQTHGMRFPIATDVSRKNLTYRTLFIRAFALAAYLGRQLPEEKNVAVLLPTSLGGVVTFFSLQLAEKVPAMLNASAGSRNLRIACETAAVKTILTSRIFIEHAKLHGVLEELGNAYSIVYLEDVRSRISLSDKLSALLRAHTPCLASARFAHQPDEPAVILFTSGSEGVPKGVVLSHANILANIYQAAARIGFADKDVMFNALPIFHSFGLSIGTLLPLMLGIRVSLYPSPLHYRVIPSLCREAGATIFLGTDTFYNGYANYAEEGDFKTVRLAVAGAEKLKESTRQLYLERFGVTIYQGYGVTETSPAISFNTPTEHRVGTVGRIFPAMEWELEPVEGLARGAKLRVSGPNVMLGYMRHNAPGVIEKQEGYYDTGDVVEIDAGGYITILGRAKRFAKIGGEMVSLAVVEECASTLWPEVAHAAIAVADERKGEQIWLATEQAGATREDLMHYAREHGHPEIALPRKVVHMETIPRLGSGKVDYVLLKAQLA